MRKRFEKAFDKVLLNDKEKNQIIENVISQKNVEKEKSGFWHGKMGGVIVVAAALLVFVLVNAAILGGMRKGTPASAVSEETVATETLNELLPTDAIEDVNVTENDATDMTVVETTTMAEEETASNDGIEYALDVLDQKIESIKAEIQAAESDGAIELSETKLAELNELYDQIKQLEEIKDRIQEIKLMDSDDLPVEEQAEWLAGLKDYLPVKNAVMTSGYGLRWSALHTGIDMTAEETTVYLVMDGTVTTYEYMSMKGNCLVIDHGNGVVTEYHHLQESLVSVGDVLSAGTPIAVYGNTGASTGPHLHWEILVNEEYRNPLVYLAEHLDEFMYQPWN